jgi:hypothetical protein
MVNITKAVQDTLIGKPNQEVVYFDAKGVAHWNIFELPKSEKDNTPTKCAKGVSVGKRVIPGTWNVEKETEDIYVADPEFIITDVLTRADVLKATPTDEIDPLEQAIKTATPESLQRIAALLAAYTAPVVEKSAKQSKKD